MNKIVIFFGVLIFFIDFAFGQNDHIIEEVGATEDLRLNRKTVQTDENGFQRVEETINMANEDSMQTKEFQNIAETFTFQTEVNRMMKLIINSLYRNKEIFLRELISNASDALDKIRLLSLTNQSVLENNPELIIKIKADKIKNILTISDTGIGMTKQDLINNLGTIAKSGTAEFLGKMQESSNNKEINDMIGQFGVGFYSAFLVANKVTVITKHNNDHQYIWESDSTSFTIVEDPEGTTIARGTTIRLHLKNEAADFLEVDTLRNLVIKYSQFINFPIYLWSSKVLDVEENDNTNNTHAVVEEKRDIDDKEVSIEDEKVENQSKVRKTVWDWELINNSKPIWTMKPSEITDDEYNNFYKSLTKDSENPLAKIHFIAEGEVTFKSLLYIPKVQPSDSFNRYGTKPDNIKLYVRRVFISDKFNDLMPNYLAFIQGIVDSDDLPLNISRENLQQHKLMKIIKKKLIRKVLDMIKKIPKTTYFDFWKEYSTNIKLGIIEDAQNRARLSKLLMFRSSFNETGTFLADYLKRMKPSQNHIYYIAGASINEVKKSPFVERLLKNNFEILYLIEAVDEYALSSIPEFDGKKFQNVAKEGFSLSEGEEATKKKQEIEKKFQPLLDYLNEKLKNYISKALVSERLTHSPCALVASMFGWTGNMERLAISNAHQKADDPQKSYYLNQKKALEINPHHPLIKELLRRVEHSSENNETYEIALMMFQTATLRSGYMLEETATFANNIEKLIGKSLGISLDEVPHGEMEEDNQEASPFESVFDNEADIEKSEERDEL